MSAVLLFTSTVRIMCMYDIVLIYDSVSFLSMVYILASAGPDIATLKFCSATYRLIKPVRPLETVTASTQDPTIQVQYRGNGNHNNILQC